MNLHLTTHMTIVLFLGVMGAPLFAFYHDQYTSHIDQAQVQHLESHSRKIKKHFQYLGLLSTPPRVDLRTDFSIIPADENPTQVYSAAVIVSCRAPPV